MSGNKVAPEGQVFVCCACGKTSPDRYGIEPGSRSYGWDASCMLNCVLAKKSHLVFSSPNQPDKYALGEVKRYDGRVMEIKDGGIVESES